MPQFVVMFVCHAIQLLFILHTYVSAKVVFHGKALSSALILHVSELVRHVSATV